MALIEYDKVYHESVVEAGKILNKIGGFRKPDQYTIATYVFQDKLARSRQEETTMLVVDAISKLRSSLQQNNLVSTPVFVDDAKERAQEALRAERERFERLEKDFADSFGK